MSIADQVGQLFMMGVPTAGLDAAAAEILERNRVGSVALLGNTTAGRDHVKDVTDDVRAAAQPPEGVKIMLAADQEGGTVQRLRGSGFDRIPSASRQASMSDRELSRNATVWGEQLRAAGIDADLAPVADIVPDRLKRTNQPIGVLNRGFGADPDVVATKVAAVVTGMDQAGVATAVKHFPGLGRVRGNTDFAANVVDSTTTRNHPDLAGFEAAAEGGVDMVMVSSAYYTRIDADHRAAFSTVIINQLIRGDLGFTGVVISDDLAAEAVRDLTPGDRAWRFLQAGGDVVIVGDPRLATAMVTTIESKVASDADFADQVTAKVARVLAMKSRRGLAQC
jgi:beta-N-acetylhexosaminidase